MRALVQEMFLEIFSRKRVIDFLFSFFIFLIKVVLNFFLKWSINKYLKGTY